MKKHFILFIVLFAVFIGMEIRGHGEEIHVTKTEDTNNPFHVGNVSLREAISRANVNGEDNVIYVPAGIYTLTIKGINEDQNATGDLDIHSNITIQGTGADATVIQAGTTPGNSSGEKADGIDRVFHITKGCIVVFTGITIRNGKAPDGENNVNENGGKGANGGGICSQGGIITLNYCIINGNNAGFGGDSTGGGTPGAGGSGGGIFCDGGSLTLYDCTVSNNYSGRCGILTNWWPMNECGKGGGIYNSGQATFDHCTIYSNAAYWGGYDADGGGIYNLGKLTITNSTISSNSSGDGFYEGGSGGGIYNSDGGIVNLINCTIAKNKVGSSDHVYHDGYGGGFFNHENGTASIKNTLIGDNEAVKVPPEEVEEHGLKGPDCYGVFKSNDFNLIEDTEACTFNGIIAHNITGQDPMLEPLADNGGPTKTHALKATSPAIDAGTGKGFPVDQRGYIRPVDIPGIQNADDGTDIGAYEYNSTSAIGEIILDRQYLYFGASTASIFTGAQSFSFKNTGAGMLNWFVYPSTDWISVSPLSGSGNGIISVSIDPTGLTTGTYTGTVTVADDQAINSPQTLQVILTVYSEGDLLSPFGEFSTPQDGSTVSGSVSFTGWALDHIGIESVKIYRDAVPGEAGNRIYIGDAVFVEGARPDVENAYPKYPFNYAAGWGYMMLSNALPNGGNGTFTFYAAATDKEGVELLLGEKTITFDNAHAIKPFGTLDTPGQGATASGKHYINYGWALTPLPNTIAEDGSTIHVWVDGKPLGNPIYNIYRSDIAELFPGYNNSNGAVGYFTLDTTAFDNGMHTISWSVEDNAGNADGIGSRYFTIQNSQSIKKNNSLKSALSNDHNLRENDASWALLPAALSDIPVDYYTPVGVKKGYNCKDNVHKFYPNEKGTICIEIKELMPLEIHLVLLVEGESLPGIKYMGYQLVNGQIRQLPIGSMLDAERGIFYWQPGPAFLGKYDFVFIKKYSSGEVKRKSLSVKVIPKFFPNL